MAWNDKYLDLMTLPVKSRMSKMGVEELEELLELVDACPYGKTHGRLNELAKSNPLWKSYRELVETALKEK